MKNRDSIEARVCGEKIRHTKRKYAKRHAKRLKKFKRLKKCVYLCEFCGMWHVGSLKKKKGENDVKIEEAT